MANFCYQLFRLVRLVVKQFLILVAIVAVLPLIPNLPPNYKFSPMPAPDHPTLTGKYSLNNLLNGADRLFEGDVIGPEAFAILNGELYTTVHGGYVAKINSKLEPVVKFGLPCESVVEEAICGRPLGIFAGADNLLYVADAYYGIFTYNTETKEKIKLFGPETVIAGRAPKLFNSISVASDGTLYWSDSSSDVTLEDGVYTLLADGTGRLIEYNQKSKKHRVLIDGMQFANGVALSPDESFVLVADSEMARIHRYWIKGPNAGQSDIFAENLPGLPDNLRAGTDGFLASLVIAADSTHPLLPFAIYPFPYIRKALARAMALTELVFETVHRYYPNKFCKQAVHFFGHFHMTKPLAPSRVTLVVFDTEGNVVESFHGTDSSLASISDAIVYRGSLYLGSPFNNYLGRISKPNVVAQFQQAFPAPLKYSVRINPAYDAASNDPPTTQKPTKAKTTTAKPPTTTPPPPPTTTAKPPTTTTTPPPTTTAKAPTTTAKPPTTTPKPTTAKPPTTTPQPATAKPPTTTSRQSTETPSSTSTTTQKGKDTHDSNEL